MSHFKQLELMFSELLAESMTVLMDSERAEIQHFIDVGEYGLALETAVDVYQEEGKAASANVLMLMERLADAMSIESTSLLSRLRKT